MHTCENKPEKRHKDLGRKWIIHGLYRKLNQESRPQMYSVLSFAEEGNMKIIRRKMIQRAEKSYSIDIVVISRHINIAYQT